MFPLTASPPEILQSLQLNNETTFTLTLRKEVIQPHLPIRLPCYDFTPVIGSTFGSSAPFHCARPGNVSFLRMLQKNLLRHCLFSPASAADSSAATRLVAPTERVRSLTSGISDSHGVTGGVYKTRERIHRDILIRDY